MGIAFSEFVEYGEIRRLHRGSGFSASIFDDIFASAGLSLEPTGFEVAFAAKKLADKVPRAL